jgi:hypothetical protein
MNQTTAAFAQGAQRGDAGSWEWLRGLFDLSPDTVHMSSMLLASHPRPVREAIEEHRRALDADPVRYLARNNNRLTAAARQAAGEYLGIHSSHVALHDSTTMGVGLIYTGLKLRPGDDVLTTTEDYCVTHESLRLAPNEPVRKSARSRSSSASRRRARMRSCPVSSRRCGRARGLWRSPGCTPTQALRFPSPP